MAVVIRVEGLGKRYALAHQTKTYATLRDTLVDGLKRLVGRGSAADASEEFWALKDIDFEIHAGAKVGIIGRNGAGKSTLLKILSRIVQPSTGRVRIRGRVASLLEVGTGFHPELSGRDNIYFNGVLLGMTRAEIRARFDEIVAFAEIEKFLDTPVKHYSSGMYVRLGFAVAAHIEPEIFIVDEVLAVGDAQFQKKCMGKMEEIGQEGRTVLFVSHSMSSVLQLTEQAVVLDRGRMAAFAPTQECVTAYLSLNGQRHEARDLDGRVPWLRVGYFGYQAPPTPPRFNQPLRFQLRLELQRPLPEFLLTINLANTVGAHLVTACGMGGPLAAGSHSLELELSDHRLLSGTYFVRLVIWQEHILLLRKDQVISLDLVFHDDGEDAALSPLLIRPNDHRGCYCPVTIAVEE